MFGAAQSVQSAMPAFGGTANEVTVGNMFNTMGMQPGFNTGAGDGWGGPTPDERAMAAATTDREFTPQMGAILSSMMLGTMNPLMGIAALISHSGEEPEIDPDVLSSLQTVADWEPSDEGGGGSGGFGTQSSPDEGGPTDPTGSGFTGTGPSVGGFGGGGGNQNSNNNSGGNNTGDSDRGTDAASGA